MPRYKVTREFFIPKNPTEVVEDEESEAVVYLWTDTRDRPCAVGFGGKRQRPDFNYSFRDERRRADYVQDYLGGQRERAERKAEKREAQREFTTSLQVGDVLVETWGYEQTNVNWYQVVEVKPSGKTVVVREIATGKSEDTGWMCGRCWPKKDAFIGEPMTKRVGKGDVLSMTNYSSAFKWDGKPEYWSSYH